MCFFQYIFSSENIFLAAFFIVGVLCVYLFYVNSLYLPYSQLEIFLNFLF
jgi:hypothetical protein